MSDGQRVVDCGRAAQLGTGREGWHKAGDDGAEKRDDGPRQEAGQRSRSQLGRGTDESASWGSWRRRARAQGGGRAHSRSGECGVGEQKGEKSCVEGGSKVIARKGCGGAIQNSTERAEDREAKG